MQVEREAGFRPCGKWRTGEERVGICPLVGDNAGKLALIPHTPGRVGPVGERFIAEG